MNSPTDVVVAPPPYKDRRGWLTFFGIIEILMGCVLLMLIAVTVFALRRVPSASQPPANAGANLALLAVIYGALAVFFVAVGIGSIQARRWARIAMLVVSWTWLVIGVLATAMMVLLMPMILQNMRQQSRAPMPANTESVARILMFFVLGFFFILLPAVFVLFYRTKNVKATCEAEGAPPELRKPVGVVVVAVWFGLAAPSYLFALAVRAAFPLFGTFVTGSAAWLTGVVMGGVSAWLGWNLYHQRALAWKAAVAWLLLNWLSVLVTMSRTGLVEMYRRLGYGEAELSRMMPFIKFGVYGGWMIAVAFLAYLLAIRKHFTEKNGSSALPPDAAMPGGLS